MKVDTDLPAKKEIVKDIVTYLRQHPHAEDTLEGILSWWLPEINIARSVGVVSQTITEMVANGILLEIKRPGLVPRYRLKQ